VSKFAPGATTASATLKGLGTCDALAFDAAGNLYVANYNLNTVSKFAPGATTAGAILTGVSQPDALAFDTLGNLYVANYSGTVSKFAPGAAGATTLPASKPDALAVDGGGNLYVANLGTNSITEFGFTSIPRMVTVNIRSSVPTRPMSLGGSNNASVIGISLTS